MNDVLNSYLYQSFLFCKSSNNVALNFLNSKEFIVFFIKNDKKHQIAPLQYLAISLEPQILHIGVKCLFAIYAFSVQR